MGYTEGMKISTAQQRALGIIAQHPGQDPRSCADGIRKATLRALERAGLISIRVLESTEQDLRRGAYGKWIGGTVTRYNVTMECTPRNLK